MRLRAAGTAILLPSFAIVSSFRVARCGLPAVPARVAGCQRRPAFDFGGFVPVVVVWVDRHCWCACPGLGVCAAFTVNA